MVGMMKRIWPTYRGERIDFSYGYASIDLRQLGEFREVRSDYIPDHALALEDLLAKLRKTLDIVTEDGNKDPYDVMTSLRVAEAE